MIVKAIKIIMMFLLFNPLLFAQKDILEDEPYSKNILFAEALGNGIGASINYERLFSKNMGIRIGLGSLIVSTISFPIVLNYYYGSTNNKLELGLGLTKFMKGENSKFIGEEGILLTSTIGLRHQKSIGGLIIRISATPFYNFEKEKFTLFGGVSLGFSL